MKILFALNHPAHYYLFKYIIKLTSFNHKIYIVIRDKDVLSELLKLENVKYHQLLGKNNGKSIISIIFNSFIGLVKQNYNLYKFCKNKRPDLMLGTDISISHIGKMINIPSLIYNEDDYEINKLFCKATYPFSSSIIAPKYTSVGKYEYKKIAYNGIQKMSYLNPKYYIPNNDITKIAKLKGKQKYFIIRVVSLAAIHDIENKSKGININLLKKIIHKLSPHGKVFISSEKKLPDVFNKYKVSIPKNRMHDFIAFSEMFIGDSQSMCAEAGILGVPFIRINDFVGKIEYLNDLENNYCLGWGILPTETKKIFNTIDEIIQNKNVKSEWLIKKELLFKEKVDLVDFSISIIKKYSKNHGV